MSLVQLPLIPDDAAREKGIFLSSDNYRIVNARISSSGEIHKFPGYELYYDFETGEGINGFFPYRSEHKYVQGSSGFDVSSQKYITDNIVVCSGGKIYHVISDGGVTTVTAFDDYKPIELNQSAPIKMCRYIGELYGYTLSAYENTLMNLYGHLDHVFMADGNGPPIVLAPSNINFNPYTSFPVARFYKEIGINARMAMLTAPKPCSHIVTLDTYAIGNNLGSSNVDFSYPGSGDRWEGDFFSSDSKVDDVIALENTRSRIVVAGYESIELWYDDGNTPFSPEANHIDSGLGAQYSLLNCENTLYWLDNKNRLVGCDIAKGIIPTQLSASLNKRLATNKYYTDATGSYIKIDNDNYYLLTFGTENKCFTVNTKNGFWSELGHWNTKESKYDTFPLWQFAYDMTLGDLGASRIDGKMYKINNNLGTFNGDEIRTLIRTPEISMGSSDRKFATRLMFNINRTADVSVADITIDPQVLIRWRDDGKTQWSNWRVINIDNPGKTVHSIEVNRLGSYRTRQYEFVLLGDYPCSISDVTLVHK